jgi:hypothetical protein
MTMKPTAWFKKVSVSGETTTVGRWYWPTATRTDKNFGAGWVETSSFLEFHDEPDWQDATKADVDAWLAAQNPS